MSGIIGYVGNACSLEILIDGLKRMGSNGTHSASVVFRNGRGLERYGNSGSIDELIELLPMPLPSVSEFLGHAAWGPGRIPPAGNGHASFFGGVTVVQQGTIENHALITDHLSMKWNGPESELPGCVVPALISSFLEQDLSASEALFHAVSMLRGSYALGIMLENEPDTLYTVRNKVPLIIGTCEGRRFFATDIYPILHQTRKFVYLEEGRLCKLSSGDIEYLNRGSSSKIKGKRIETETTEKACTVDSDDEDYHVYRDIREQPQSILDTISEWIANPRQLLEDRGLGAMLLAKLSDVHIVACGTSYHAAIVGKYLIEEYSRVPVHVETASEYRHRRPIIGSRTLFISITQSGETSDTLAAQDEAKARGARTLTICNVKDSTSALRADHVIYTQAGFERGISATKSFTAQLATLYLISFALGIIRGRITAPEGDALQRHFLKVPHLIEKVLYEEPFIKKVAGHITSSRHILLFGMGLNYPVALEGAFKLNEIANIPSEGFPSGELRHSPLTLIEEGVPVVFLAPTDDIFIRTVSSISEIRKRGGHIIAVTDDESCMRDHADVIIPIPAAHPALSPFVNTVALQLLAYHAGLQRGCDVDNPRYLVKSVTGDDH